MGAPWLAPPPMLGGLEDVKLSAANTDLSFAVRWLGALVVRGRFTELSGTVRVPPEGVEQATVRVEVATASVRTGIALRDRHLREPVFLDARRFPAITFRADAPRWRGTHLYMPGMLTVRGVEHPCDLTCTFDGAPANGTRELRASAEAMLRRTDFGVACPVGRLGRDPRFLVISDEVYVRVALRATAAR